MYYIAAIYDQLVQETSLTNCAMEFLGEKDWQLPKYSTWGNPSNTYKHKEKDDPQIYDHIFHKVNPLKNVKVKTIGVDVQIFKIHCPTMTVEPTNKCPNISTTLFNLNLTITTCPNNPFLPTSKRSVNTQLDLIDQTLRSECIKNEMISLSDHEAITATLRIEKHKPGNFKNVVSAFFPVIKCLSTK